MLGIVERRIGETWMIGLLLAALPVLAALPALADGPSRLVIDPNAIVAPDEPIEVVIEGIPEGESVRLWVLGDCDGDSQPDQSAKCPALFDRESQKARKGVIRDRLEPGTLEKLPRNEPLWLRAATAPEARGERAMFTIGGDGCGFFASVAGILGGPCEPASLLQLLRRHRQPSDLQDAIFEVRLLHLGGEEPSTSPIPYTRGASGAAWARGGSVMVVTFADPDRGAREPGVYFVELDGKTEPEPIWTPTTEECQAHAPRALTAKRVAVVCQPPGPQPQNASGDVARLVVLEGGEVKQTVPLPFGVHQLLASSEDGNRILALSLGIGDNQPIFLSIELESARAEILGFSNAFYQSAMREPGGGPSLIAFENTYGGYGWQLALADGEDFLDDVVKRTNAHDLAPAWHPEGGQALYLAQVDTVVSSP
jgi:hypothetical protein